MGSPSIWSRDLPVPEGTTLTVFAGPLEVLAARHEHEWRVGARWSRDDGDDHRSGLSSEKPARFDEFERVVRVPVAGIDSLRLLAVTADRPLIAKPSAALLVPPGATGVVFLGTPAWARVVLGDAIVLDLPVRRLSDTWFGPNTREGQLCYASRTQARTSLGELVRLAGRVITRAEIVNETRKTIEIESLGLPMPAMSVFEGDDGALWTEGVHVELRAGGSTTHVVDVPREAGRTQALGEPREPTEAGGLVRAFTALIGGSIPWSG